MVPNSQRQCEGMRNYRHQGVTLLVNSEERLISLGIDYNTSSLSQVTFKQQGQTHKIKVTLDLARASNVQLLIRRLQYRSVA